MAIFTESVCLNWLNEEASLKFTNSKTYIGWDKSIKDKDQIIKALNSNWNRIKVKIYKYIQSASSKYYGNEKIDPNKILNKVNLDAIAFEDNTETVNVYMTYNKDKKVKDFLGGHELMVYVEIYRNGYKDYEIYDDDISVEI